jgi:hypothetical protein
MFYLKQAGIGLLSGLIAGLVLGIGARLAMRVVALAAHRASEFSLEGTLIILMIGAIIGLVTGLIFVAVRRYLPGGPLWKGLLFGALVFLVQIPLLPPPIKEEIAQAGGRLPLIVGLFGAVFVSYGIVLQVIAERLSPRTKNQRFSDNRRLPERTS